MYLGVFDSSSDGIFAPTSAPLSVSLWDETSQSMLAQVNFSYGDAGELVSIAET